MINRKLNSKTPVARITLAKKIPIDSKKRESSTVIKQPTPASPANNLLKTITKEKLEELSRASSLSALKKDVSPDLYELLFSKVKNLNFQASNGCAAATLDFMNNGSTILNGGMFAISAGTLAIETTLAISGISGFLMIWVIISFFRKLKKSNEIKKMTEDFILAQIKREIIIELLDRQKAEFLTEGFIYSEPSSLANSDRSTQASLSCQHASSWHPENIKTSEKDELLPTSELKFPQTVKISNWKKAEIFFQEGFINISMTMFASFYLGVAYLLSGLGVAAAVALSGPVGLGIAFGVSLIAGIYIGYKQYQRYKQEKLLKKSLAVVENDISEKEEHYKEQKLNLRLHKMEKNLTKKLLEKKAKKTAPLTINFNPRKNSNSSRFFDNVSYSVASNDEKSSLPFMPSSL